MCVQEKTKIRLQKAQSFLSSPFPPRRKIFDSFIVGSRSSQGLAPAAAILGPYTLTACACFLHSGLSFLE